MAEYHNGTPGAGSPKHAASVSARAEFSTRQLTGDDAGGTTSIRPTTL